MKNKALQSLIKICRDGRCTVTLEASNTGIVATVFAQRGVGSKKIAIWLDAQDKRSGEKLDEVVKQVQ